MRKLISLDVHKTRDGSGRDNYHYDLGLYGQGSRTERDDSTGRVP